MRQFRCVVGYVTAISILMLMMVTSTSQCDTKQIRLMYLWACGAKRKRGGAEFHQELQRAENNLARYPPAGQHILKALMTGGSDLSMVQESALSNEDAWKEAWNALKMDGGGVALGGMRDADAEYLMSDLMDENWAKSDIFQREISGLIEKCCKYTPSHCSAKDFISQC